MPLRAALVFLCLCLTLAACAQNAPIAPPAPDADVRDINMTDENMSIQGKLWEADGKLFIRGTLALLQVNAGQYRGAKLTIWFMKDGKKVDSTAVRLRYNRNANRFDFEGEVDTDKEFDKLSFMVRYAYRVD